MTDDLPLVCLSQLKEAMLPSEMERSESSAPPVAPSGPIRAIGHYRWLCDYPSDLVCTRPSLYIASQRELFSTFLHCNAPHHPSIIRFAFVSAPRYPHLEGRFAFVSPPTMRRASIAHYADDTRLAAVVLSFEILDLAAD